MRVSVPIACLVPLLALACAESPEPMFASQRGGGDRNAEAPSEGVAAAQPPQKQPPRPTPAPPAQQVQTGDQRAPDRFTVRMDTTKGPILIDVQREWAPYGADRFYTLVREGYYTHVAFFRVIDGFMAQAGIHGDPAMNTRWRERRIPDDPVRQSNTRGMVSYAMAGPGSRTTQFFINFGDNSNLDAMGFAPFGRVRDMATVDRLYEGYGEGAPRGRGPEQGRMQREGNTYLRADFPQLDYIRSATIEGS